MVMGGGRGAGAGQGGWGGWQAAGRRWGGRGRGNEVQAVQQVRMGRGQPQGLFCSPQRCVQQFTHSTTPPAATHSSSAAIMLRGGADPAIATLRRCLKRSMPWEVM